MDLTKLKRLCYNAAIIKEFAESNEKALKLQFIKECFLKNLKEMDVSECGVYSLNMEKKYIEIGFNEKLPLVSLNYNPLDEKQNSLCGITAFCFDREKNSMTLNLAIDNLSMTEIHNIFIHLTIMFGI